jgi:hypothetical protein
MVLAGAAVESRRIMPVVCLLCASRLPRVVLSIAWAAVLPRCCAGRAAGCWPPGAPHIV